MPYLIRPNRTVKWTLIGHKPEIENVCFSLQRNASRTRSGLVNQSFDTLRTRNDFCNLPKPSTNDCWDRCGSCNVLHDRTTLFQAFRSPQLAHLVSLLFIGQRNDGVMVSHPIQCEQSAKPLLADVGAPITLCYNVTRCIAFNNIIIIITSRDRAKNEDNLRYPWRCAYCQWLGHQQRWRHASVENSLRYPSTFCQYNLRLSSRSYNPMM